MARASGEHRLEPVVDGVFLFDETPEALSYLGRGEHFGKICIRHPVR